MNKPLVMKLWRKRLTPNSIRQNLRSH